MVMPSCLNAQHPFSFRDEGRPGISEDTSCKKQLIFSRYFDLERAWFVLPHVVLLYTDAFALTHLSPMNSWIESRRALLGFNICSDSGCLLMGEVRSFFSHSSSAERSYVLPSASSTGSYMVSIVSGQRNPFGIFTGDRFSSMEVSMELSIETVDIVSSISSQSSFASCPRSVKAFSFSCTSMVGFCPGGDARANIFNDFGNWMTSEFYASIVSSIITQNRVEMDYNAPSRDRILTNENVGVDRTHNKKSQPRTVSSSEKWSDHALYFESIQKYSM